MAKKKARASGAGAGRCFSSYGRCLDRCMANAFGDGGDIVGDLGSPEFESADSLPEEGPSAGGEFAECLMACEEQFVDCVSADIEKWAGNRMAAATARVLARSVAASLRAAATNLRQEIAMVRSRQKPTRGRGRRTS